jgi:uncharacterized protein
MPRLERDEAPPGPVVRGFAEGGFSVDGSVYRAVLLTPAAALEWSPPPLGELARADLEPLLGLRPPPEFVIVGTGPGLIHPPAALRRALDELEIGLEVMDSRAAARLWGLLRSEERWIAAALMPL